VRESAVVFEESKGIGQLLAMFNNPEKMAEKAARRTTKKITVEAAEKDQASGTTDTQKAAKNDVEEVDSDSDDIFDAIEDEVNKENPDKNTADKLEEAVEQGLSFIQMMFDSQVKRFKDEKEAMKKAGLSAFKSTGNPLADAMRRYLEKKMKEMFNEKMEEM